jgi:hypothetical protein
VSIHSVARIGVLIDNMTSSRPDTEEILFHGTTETQTVTTNGLSAAEMRARVGKFYDPHEGFSLTPHIDIAEQFAKGRAADPSYPGDVPTVIEVPRSSLDALGVRLVPGEVGELKIPTPDFSKVGPGVFRRSGS